MDEDAPAGPRVVETHISTVVLLGDRALKFPKPLLTDFLDQSTPEKRRASCEREVALNRRLAPDVYLGVGEVRDGDTVVDSFIVSVLADPRELLRIAEQQQVLRGSSDSDCVGD